MFDTKSKYIKLKRSRKLNKIVILKGLAQFIGALQPGKNSSYIHADHDNKNYIVELHDSYRFSTEDMALYAQVLAHFQAISGRQP